MYDELGAEKGLILGAFFKKKSFVFFFFFFLGDFAGTPNSRKTPPKKFFLGPVGTHVRALSARIRLAAAVHGRE